MNHNKVSILGIRGIPAQHGGFETFAEHFAVYLQRKGWQVDVYCQVEGNGQIYEDVWCGIRRIQIPVSKNGAMGTVFFDWKSTVHASRRKNPILTLGYNTAIFCAVYRLKGIKNVINMDGVEWKRGKWSTLERSWLYLNEKVGAWLGNHLIADHPEIKNHLTGFVSAGKVTMIPYGADLLESADENLLYSFNLKPYSYALLIARPEKENSIIDIVSAYSQVKVGFPLVVLGNYTPETNSYHKTVNNAASDEIQFVGAIYNKKVVQALRFFARFYIHGHTVGGTNPSLVEALGAGAPVLAHDNMFNRWVAGERACYFSSKDDCAQQINNLAHDDQLIASMKRHSFNQIKNKFTRDKIHGEYERLLLDHLVDVVK